MSKIETIKTRIYQHLQRTMPYVVWDISSHSKEAVGLNSDFFNKIKETSSELKKEMQTTQEQSRRRASTLQLALTNQPSGSYRQDSPKLEVLDAETVIRDLESPQSQIPIGLYPSWNAYYTSWSKAELGVVVAIDIDKFKTVNDKLGKTKGSELIMKIFELLIECVDKQRSKLPENVNNNSAHAFYALHKSGDEFVIKAPSFVIAFRTCKMVSDELKQRRDIQIIENHDVTLTMAIGGCLRNADQTLIAAKGKDPSLRGNIVADQSSVDWTLYIYLLNNGRLKLHEQDDVAAEPVVVKDEFHCQKILDKCKRKDRIWNFAWFVHCVVKVGLVSALFIWLWMCCRMQQTRLKWLLEPLLER